MILLDKNLTLDFPVLINFASFEIFEQGVIDLSEFIIFLFQSVDVFLHELKPHFMTLAKPTTHLCPKYYKSFEVGHNLINPKVK